MNWYLIYGKSDDYGACTFGLIKCKKSDLKHVYFYKKVEKKDVDVLKKYIDTVTDYIDEDESLTDYLEEYYS